MPLLPIISSVRRLLGPSHLLPALAHDSPMAACANAALPIVALLSSQTGLCMNTSPAWPVRTACDKLSVISGRASDTRRAGSEVSDGREPRRRAGATRP